MRFSRESCPPTRSSDQTLAFRLLPRLQLSGESTVTGSYHSCCMPIQIFFPLIFMTLQMQYYTVASRHSICFSILQFKDKWEINSKYACLHNIAPVFGKFKWPKDHILSRNLIYLKYFNRVD